ncbi:Ras guanine nucleotide exchange factor [Planoprotostelium fungivorum]|uniref:Ras guanine nucleotide exchange factor n=1 Tax=Planoprotostelium fungivorum TaxID=1890364 RepID=A0A2P6NN98_9EUKA|nr:Ras guanine nucleotide exchange factor [Planoprotostelium fungivorum]
MSWEDFDEDVPNSIPDISQPAKSWEDEDAESSEEEASPNQPHKPSTRKKGPKPISKKKKNALAKAQDKQEEEDEDPETARMRNLRLQQDSDLMEAQDMFAGVESLINLKNPKDEKDFQGLGTTLSEKLLVHSKSIHYKTFIKTLLKGMLVNASVDDIKDLASAVNVIANDKIKSEKDTTKPKKKKGGVNLKNVNAGTRDNDLFGRVEEERGAYNDDDFMRHLHKVHRMEHETKEEVKEERPSSPQQYHFMPPNILMLQKRYSLGDGLLNRKRDREESTSEAESASSESQPDDTRPSKLQASTPRRGAITWDSQANQQPLFLSQGPSAADKLKSFETEREELRKEIDSLKEINRRQQKQIERLSRLIPPSQPSIVPPSLTVDITPPTPRLDVSVSNRMHDAITSQLLAPPMRTDRSDSSDSQETSGYSPSQVKAKVDRVTSNDEIHMATPPRSPLIMAGGHSPNTSESQYSSIFLEYEQDKSQEETKETSGGVMSIEGGHLEQLCNRLISFRPLDGDYVRDFLMGYAYFTDNEHLLQQLERLYRFQCPDGASDEVHYYYEQNRKIVQKKVGMLLKSWIDNNFESVYQTATYNKLSEFIMSQPTLSSKIQIPLQPTRKIAQEEEPQSSRTSLKQMKPVLGISDVSPRDMAKQLALYEMQLFSDITIPQLRCHNWYKEENRETFAPAVSIMTNWFNVEILKPDLKSRVNELKRVIRLAEECRQLSNYNAVMEIYAALNTVPIVRLKKTWKELPEKYRTMYEGLSTLMESSSNFRNYRSELKRSHRPAIPYLGMTLRDLVFMEEANPEKLTNGMINFGRIKIISQAICNFVHYQHKTYTFQVMQEVQEYLKCVAANHPMTSENLLELSYAVEARKPEHDTEEKKVGSGHSFLDKIVKVVAHSHSPVSSTNSKENVSLTTSPPQASDTVPQSPTPERVLKQKASKTGSLRNLLRPNREE